MLRDVSTQAHVSCYGNVRADHGVPDWGAGLRANEG
jgi:hypothetical protein